MSRATELSEWLRKLAAFDWSLRGIPEVELKRATLEEISSLLVQLERERDEALAKHKIVVAVPGQDGDEQQVWIGFP